MYATDSATVHHQTLFISNITDISFYLWLR